jgi:predicted MarR family transcription regulator
MKLDNERTMTVVSLLPRLAQHSEGFRTRDLRNLLSEVTQTSLTTPQVSYTLRKLRAKHLIDRPSGQTRYRITPQGIRLAAVLPFLADRLCNSLISLARDPIKTKLPDKFVRSLDQHYYQIEKEMSSITKTLGLMAA